MVGGDGSPQRPRHRLWAYRAFDKASVFMMRGPSYRGCGFDTYSVEAVPQATKVRGTQPKGV